MLSARSQVQPFVAMDVLARARKQARDSGKEVISLSVGQPTHPIPPEVTSAIAESLKAPPSGYADSWGIQPLREKIAAYYHQTHKLEISPSRIFVTTGSSAAFMLAALAAFDHGARIAMAVPYYPAYRNMLESLGASIIFIEGRHDRAFQPTLEQLKECGHLDGLIIASPSNPVGGCIEAGELEAISLYCEGAGIQLISDEIYHGITYGAPCVTAAAFSSRAIVVNSFSKYFLMPGFRLGWAVVPEKMARTFECLAQNYLIAAPTYSQVAALEALNHAAYFDSVVAGYAKNRALLMERLPALGLGNFAMPDGAFYFYIDVSNITKDSYQLCLEILEKAGVALVPGVDFDRDNGHKYLRLSYCTSHEKVSAALERLAVFFTR